MAAPNLNETPTTTTAAPRPPRATERTTAPKPGTKAPADFRFEDFASI